MLHTANEPSPYCKVNDGFHSIILLHARGVEVHKNTIIVF